MESPSMIVHVKDYSESGEHDMCSLNINADNLIKHVKEQIEINTGINTAKQCLLHRFDNGRMYKLWQCHGNGKVSSYCIKDGSTLVLRYKPPPSAYPPRPLSKTKVKKHVNKAMHRCAGPSAPSSQ